MRELASQLAWISPAANDRSRLRFHERETSPSHSERLALSPLRLCTAIFLAMFTL